MSPGQELERPDDSKLGALHELKPDAELSQLDQLRGLAIRVGSVALNGGDHD